MSLAGALLSGKMKPLFLKAKPVSLSRGAPLWQKLQFRRVCLAKLGVAPAFGVGKISAEAMSATTRAPADAMGLSLRKR